MQKIKFTGVQKNSLYLNSYQIIKPICDRVICMAFINTLNSKSSGGAHSDS